MDAKTTLCALQLDYYRNMFTTLTDIVHYIKISMELIATIHHLYV